MFLSDTSAESEADEGSFESLAPACDVAWRRGDGSKVSGNPGFFGVKNAKRSECARCVRMSRRIRVLEREWEWEREFETRRRVVVLLGKRFDSSARGRKRS